MTQTREEISSASPSLTPPVPKPISLPIRLTNTSNDITKTTTSEPQVRTNSQIRGIVTPKLMANGKQDTTSTAKFNATVTDPSSSQSPSSSASHSLRLRLTALETQNQKHVIISPKITAAKHTQRPLVDSNTNTDAPVAVSFVRTTNNVNVNAAPNKTIPIQRSPELHPYIFVSNPSLTHVSVPLPRNHAAYRTNRIRRQSYVPTHSHTHMYHPYARYHPNPTTFPNQSKTFNLPPMRNYRDHSGTAMSESTKPLQIHCPKCGLSFTSQELTTHMRSHINPGRFHCNRCPKRYQAKESLTRHMKIHVTTKKFACKECGSRFMERHLLKRHERSHDQRKLYCCGLCGKQYKMQASLSKHIARYHEHGWIAGQ